MAALLLSDIAARFPSLVPPYKRRNDKKRKKTAEENDIISV